MKRVIQDQENSSKYIIIVAYIRTLSFLLFLAIYLLRDIHTRIQEIIHLLCTWWSGLLFHFIFLFGHAYMLLFATILNCLENRPFHFPKKRFPLFHFLLIYIIHTKLPTKTMCFFKDQTNICMLSLIILLRMWFQKLCKKWFFTQLLCKTCTFPNKG